MNHRLVLPLLLVLASPAAGASGALGRPGAGTLPLQADVRPIVHDGRVMTTVWHSLAPNGESWASSAPCGIDDGGFLFGLGSWTATVSAGSPAGSVSTATGAATLVEGGSFLVTLQQTFCMPAGATELTFDLTSAAFDLSSSFIPDAFEVALLDANGIPVVPAWTLASTAFYNRQEDGTENLGVTTTSDGTTISVDIGSVAAGTSLTVVFDLVGGDFDTGSTVVLDDVRAVGPCSVLAMTQLYGAGVAGELGEPALSLTAPPILGTGVQLVIGSSTAVPTHGCLMIGTAPIQVPTGLGGDLLVDYVALLPFDLPPTGLELPFAVPAQVSSCGLTVYLQALVVDVFAPGSLASSQGFEVVVGG